MVDVLRKSAEAGMAALSNEIRTLERQLEEYRQNDEFDGERDEDGHVLWDRDELLSHEISLAQEALIELRKAFAIAAYHHWERSVQLWIAQKHKVDMATGISVRKTKPARGYEQLSNAAQEIGFPTNAEFQRVVTLANTLKHNSETYGAKLLELWPDIFPSRFSKPSNVSDWVSAIHLNDGHLTEIFRIVSKSGPIAFPAWKPRNDD